MNDQTYNGWSNYETWLANLWLSNDQGSYEASKEVVQDAVNDYDAGQALKAWVEDGAMGELPETGFLADIINAALVRVDWMEIAQHMREP